MFFPFAQRITHILTTQGFHPASDSAMATTFLRQDGGVLYAFALWDIDSLGEAAFAAYESQLQQNLAAQSEQFGLRSVILFSVAACHAPSVQLLARLAEQETFYGQPVYTLSYIASLDDKQLHFDPAANMLHADEWLSAALRNDADTSLPAPRANSTQHKPVVRHPWLTYAILLVNAIVLALMEFAGGSESISVLLRFGAVEYDAIIIEHEWHRLFTATFIHIGLAHFVYNAMSLFIFGTRVERHFGRVRFLAIYLLSGVIGNAAQLLFPGAVSAGASGALFGLMGATLALAQITKKTIDGVSFYVILIFMVAGLAYGFVAPNIGNAAHIGGLVSGYLMGILLCRRKTIS